MKNTTTNINMNKKIKTIELFRTKDLVVASALYADGQKLVSTEMSNAGQTLFVFEDKSACESLVQKHYTGELILPSRQLLDAVRTLKSIIFNS